MPTWRQRNRRLGLTGAEVQMIFVVWNRLVQRGQRRVYQKMMMAKICLFDPSGRETHIDEAESDRKRLRDVIPIGRRNDILFGAGRRSVSSRRGRTGGGRRRGRSHGGDVYMDAWRHHRGRVRNMVLVAEQKL